MNILDLIKKMRKITGIGILQCKQYIEKYNLDLDLAIYNMKKDFLFNNLDLFNKMNSGIILVKLFKSVSVMLKLNCETDFVSKNNLFIQLGINIINYSYLFNNFNIYYLNNKFKKKINFIKKQFNEEIILNNIVYFNNNIHYGYQHFNRIGSIILCNGLKFKSFFLKQISIHIVANNPLYISIFDIPFDEFNKEIDTNYKLFQNKNVFKSLVNKMSIILNNSVLLYQKFLFNQFIVLDNLLLNNYLILDFYRFEI